MTYARYQFLKDKNIIIDESNYRLLFNDAKTFEKRFGVTKNELLGKYSYDKYKKISK